MVDSDWAANFRENLRIAVEYRDTTFSDLALRIHGGRPGLSRLVNGHQDATLTRAGQIAAALNLPLPQMLQEPQQFRDWIRKRTISLVAS